MRMALQVHEIKLLFALDCHASQILSLQYVAGRLVYSNRVIQIAC
jgi:hypothetical protein